MPTHPLGVPWKKGDSRCRFKPWPEIEMQEVSFKVSNTATLIRGLKPSPNKLVSLQVKIPGWYCIYQWKKQDVDSHHEKPPETLSSCVVSKLCKTVSFSSWWFQISTHLKNISQFGSFHQIGMNIKKCLKPPPSFLKQGIGWLTDPDSWKLGSTESQHCVWASRRSVVARRPVATRWTLLKQSGHKMPGKDGKNTPIHDLILPLLCWFTGVLSMFKIPGAFLELPRCEMESLLPRPQVLNDH